VRGQPREKNADEGSMQRRGGRNGGPEGMDEVPKRTEERTKWVKKYEKSHPVYAQMMPTQRRRGGKNFQGGSVRSRRGKSLRKEQLSPSERGARQRDRRRGMKINEGESEGKKEGWANQKINEENRTKEMSRRECTARLHKQMQGRDRR